MTAGRIFSYNKTDWNTPEKYVKAVLDVFGYIDLDPCSNINSIVPSRVKYIYPENDGLRDSWDFNRIYINPPFGKGLNGTTIYDWLGRGYNETRNGNNVMALIPVATNTKHWKEFVFKSDVICFLGDTRLKFRINNSENNKGISVSCAMALWGDEYKNKFIEVFENYGNIR